MDTKNLFMTPVTAWLVRSEYALGLVVSIVLLFAHAGDVNWWAAAGLFLYIDLIGYIPGAIAFRRKGHGEISKGYYVAYNFMHSHVVQGLVALVWIWAWGPEWALLALPIHLFGDRALFGNFYKPFGLLFEPETHQAYRRFSSEFTATTAASGTDALRTVA
jgi:hypothetical protein